MTDEHPHLYHPRRQVVLAAAVFAVLALLLNTATFVNWAREAPFPPDLTEWLIRQADTIHQFGQDAGFGALHDGVQAWVADLRER